MYQVLYRKWRPQSFADVYGQDQVTAALRNELRTGRLAHAYLFTGSRGTGKTTCAKNLAKAVNSQQPRRSISPLPWRNTGFISSTRCTCFPPALSTPC